MRCKLRSLMLLLALTLGSSSSLLNAQQTPTFYLNTGLSVFSEHNLMGPGIGAEVCFPIYKRLELSVGGQSSNAHSLDFIAGAKEGVYSIAYNALSAKLYVRPFEFDKHVVLIGLGSQFYWSGFSYFYYKEMRPVDSDETELIREFFMSGRRNFSFLLSAKYCYRLKISRFYMGGQYDYFRYKSIHSSYQSIHNISFLFGVDL